MQKGFFGSLFGISLSSPITTKVIKVIYVISMIVIRLGALFLVIAGFAQDTGTGLLMLIVVAPLGALLYLIYTRVLLEVIIGLFRIMETNRELVELQRRAVPAAAPASAAPPSAPPPPQASSARAVSPPPNVNDGNEGRLRWRCGQFAALYAAK